MSVISWNLPSVLFLTPLPAFGLLRTYRLIQPNLLFGESDGKPICLRSFRPFLPSAPFRSFILLPIDLNQPRPPEPCRRIENRATGDLRPRREIDSTRRQTVMLGNGGGHVGIRCKTCVARRMLDPRFISCLSFQGKPVIFRSGSHHAGTKGPILRSAGNKHEGTGRPSRILARIASSSSSTSILLTTRYAPGEPANLLFC